MDDPVALLPVLIAHENATTRESYPNLARLAILAGVSKATAGSGVRLLEGNNLLRIEQRPAARGRIRHVYIMQYPPYAQGESDSGQWIRLDREIVMQGVWAAMRPATRRLYLVLRAHCLRQEYADGERWVNPGDLEGVQAEGSFLPAQFMSQDFLMQFTGLASRTIRDSRQWLLDSGLVFPTHCSQAPGLILPFSPGRHAPTVLHALQASQEHASSQEYGAASGYINRTLQGMRRQQHRIGAKKRREVAIKKIL